MNSVQKRTFNLYPIYCECYNIISGNCRVAVCLFTSQLLPCVAARLLYEWIETFSIYFFYSELLRLIVSYAFHKFPVFLGLELFIRLFVASWSSIIFLHSAYNTQLQHTIWIWNVIVDVVDDGCASLRVKRRRRREKFIHKYNFCFVQFHWEIEPRHIIVLTFAHTFTLWENEWTNVNEHKHSRLTLLRRRWMLLLAYFIRFMNEMLSTT